MRSPSPQQVFRLVGLAATAVVGLEAMAMPVDLPADLAPTAVLFARAVYVGVVGLLLGLFAWLLWTLLSPVPQGRPLRRAILLLVLQTLLALACHTDLMLILAAELPFVLPTRAAAGWLAAQLTAALLVGVNIYVNSGIGPGGFEPSPGFAGLPAVWAVSLTLLSLTAWQGFSFAIGWLAAVESRSRQHLARSNAELVATRHLLAESTRIAERGRLARELHDAVGHHLTVLAVQLELARRRLVAGDAAAAAEPVAESASLARGMLAEVRQVVGRLRQQPPLDLGPALAALLAPLRSPRARLALPETLPVDDPEVAAVALRVVQEAVTNALRHAHASELAVSLALATEARPPTLIVEIRDDGRGTTTVKAGHGLRGMSERVAALGGSLDLTSAAGAGFTVRATLPLQPSARSPAADGGSANGAGAA